MHFERLTDPNERLQRGDIIASSAADLAGVRAFQMRCDEHQISDYNDDYGRIDWDPDENQSITWVTDGGSDNVVWRPIVWVKQPVGTEMVSGDVILVTPYTGGDAAEEVANHVGRNPKGVRVDLIRGGRFVSSVNTLWRRSGSGNPLVNSKMKRASSVGNRRYREPLPLP